MPPFLNYFAKYECDCRCFDIFTPEEQKILKKYREENFAPKRLVYNERRAIGKCPLTPEEVKVSFALIYPGSLYMHAGGNLLKIMIMIPMI